MGEQFRITVGDAPGEHRRLHVLADVGGTHVSALAEHGSECDLGRRELKQVEHVAVLVEPAHRGEHAERDLVERIVVGADGLLLTSAQ